MRERIRDAGAPGANQYGATPGYSEDKYCEEAREKIRKACGDDSLAVHFLVGGTQTNVTVINAALRKHQACSALSRTYQCP